MRQAWLNCFQYFLIEHKLVCPKILNVNNFIPDGPNTVALIPELFYGQCFNGS
jgi:hypothetical protein